ncbi:MAG: hypothetical protein JST02_14130, partial [Bacteroidetes bacterium]|nr:hypothetical protein [Bacteroidota bacterium]
MKRLLILIQFTLLINGITKAQYVSLPNDSFKTFLLNRYPSCFNAAGDLDTTCTAIITEDSLEFHGLSGSNNYTALAYFDNLVFLNCSNNVFNGYQSTTVFPNKLPQTLQKLVANNCYINNPYVQISYSASLLSTLPPGLKYIEFSNNFQGSGDEVDWPTSLTYLNVSYGKFNAHNRPLPSGLDTLICNNQVRENGALAGPLNFLPSPLPASLKYLDCHENSVLNLPALPSSLEYLDVGSQNQFWGLSGDVPVQIFFNLPALPASLKVLKCNKLHLTSVPPLPQGLVYLDCSDQRFNFSVHPLGTVSNAGISALPQLPQTLRYLICGNNPIGCLPNIPPAMNGVPGNSIIPYNLEITSTNVACLPNWVPGIVIHNAGSTFPLCENLSINPCGNNPLINGFVFHDNNSNGVFDAGETSASHIKVKLNSNTYTYSNANGRYSFAAPLGANLVTIQQPAYYNAVPGTFNYNFSSVTSIVNDTVALKPVAVADSIRIWITASNNPRPNEPLSYNIQYENMGTSTVNATIKINFNLPGYSNLLIYNFSSISGITQAGNTLTFNTGSLSPGQGGVFDSYFTVNNFNVPGFPIKTIATATAGTSISTDSSTVILVAPIDPNDKQATPLLTFNQVSSGHYIDYLVRFQNVGTSYAVNIYIADTLSPLLQQNTLELDATSHNCKVTLTGNKLFIKFTNIFLPDSNANEPASHGFVRFRVKPSNTLPTNTVTDIPNKASIYFDYNLPVVTNTANTIIALDTIPSSFTQQNPVCANINDGRITINSQGTTGPLSYVLTGPGGPYTQSNPQFANLAPGTYYYRFSDNAGRVGMGGPILLTSNSPLTETLVKTEPLCHSDATGKIVLSASGGVPGYQYALSPFTSYQGNTFTGLTAGTYTFRIKDNVGCTKDTTVTLTAPTLLSASASSLTAATCSGNDGTIVVSGSGGTGGYSYSIEGISFQASNMLSAPAPGTYPNIKVKDANGCIANASATVALVDAMFLTLGSDKTICSGSSVQMLPQSNPGTAVWAWRPLNPVVTPPSTIDMANISTATMSPTDIATYILHAQWGVCSREDTITINVLRKPVVFAGLDTAICENTDAALRGNAGNLSGTVNYSWSPAADIASPNDAVTTVHPLSPGKTYTYILTVTDNYGCNFSVSDDVNITVQAPVRAFAGNDTIAVFNSAHQLMGSGGIEYLWSPAAPLNLASSQNPLATLKKDQLFILKVTDIAGCIGYDSVFVKVYEGPDYHIPNAFTPNGDGLNDIFRAVPSG